MHIYYLSIIILFIILCFYILDKYIIDNTNTNRNANQNIEYFKNEELICCFYAYYEKNDSYKNNFIYFLNNGILDNVDYHIIINGKCSVEIPKRNNITIYTRENKGFDFGAYGHAIKKITKKYDYYFFINTSVCGPYLKDKDKQWTSYFIELFNNDVKLVGTSINVFPYESLIKGFNLKDIYGKDKPFTHIQSMFFCIDSYYFDYLNSINFFDEDTLNKETNMYYVIANKEIGLSQILLKKGYNINSILPKYKGIDYRLVNSNFNYSAPNGDPYFKNKYFGDSIDKYDVIFFKTNRGF